MLSICPDASFAVAVTVTVPFEMAVSKPFASIEAEPVPSVTLHVYVASSAFACKQEDSETLCSHLLLFANNGGGSPLNGFQRLMLFAVIPDARITALSP